MATQVQRRRGTTVQHAVFTGALAEVTVDTDKHTLVVHDGSTAGGFPLSKESDLTSHLNDTVDAHDASAISVLDTAGNFVATDVEGALAELAAVPTGLMYFTEARNTTAPNAAVPVHSVSATGTEVDIDAMIGPKGAGAILTDIPDDTATGGNKRGTSAVDLQTIRSGAAEVASGNYSSITGGKDNKASALYAVVGGGNGNYSTGQAATIPGGNLNVASASYSTTGGGYVNTASGYGSTIAGGASNQAIGNTCTVGGGDSNTADINDSTVGGGRLNTAGAPYSTIPGGYYGTTRSMYGKFAYASGRFSVAGDSQIGMSVVRKTTLDATPIDITSDGAATSAVNISVLPDNHAYTVSVLVSARSTGGSVASFTIIGAVKRGTGVATTAIVGTPTVTTIAQDAALAGTTATIIADTVYGGVKVRVTGVAATTINWTAKIDTVEVG